MFRPFADWIASSQLSMWLAATPWVVPTSQSFHILAIAIVFTSACMINLRLLGVTRPGRPVSELTSSLTRWMWRGLAVLLFTGLIQTIAEPVRQFVTPAYWAKMAMIVIVSMMTYLYARAARRLAQGWDATGAIPLATRVFAVTSTLLWLAIIVCGRLIGYVWSNYV